MRRLCLHDMGVTLFELLVVLLIIGMAFGLALPRIVSSMPGLQLKAAAQKTAAFLRWAGNRTVSEQRQYCVALDAANERLLLFTRNEQSNPSEPNAMQLLGTHTLKMPEGISFRMHGKVPRLQETGYPTISFYPRGGCSGGELIFSNERGRRLRVGIDFITSVVTISE